MNHPLIGRLPPNQNNACTLADGYRHLTYLKSPTTTVRPSSIYPHIHMPVLSNISLHPRATRTTVTVKNAGALKPAIDFYYANRSTITIELRPRKNRSPTRKSEFLFGELQPCIAFHILSFDVQLLLAENCKHVPKHMRRKWCLQSLKKHLWRNGAL